MSFQISAVCFAKTGAGQALSEDQVYFAGEKLTPELNGTEHFLNKHLTSKTLQSFCVFDGISEEGAHAAPLSDAAFDGYQEAASVLALNESLDSELLVRMQGILNRLVYRRKETANLTDSGVSSLCFLMEQNQLYLTWVGDCRAYCMRNSVFRRLNEPQPGFFTRLPAQYLGMDEKLALDPRTMHGSLKNGDQFLLTSGNFGELPEKGIEAIIGSKQSLIGKGRALMELADEEGIGGDRTLILLRVEEEAVEAVIPAEEKTAAVPAAATTLDLSNAGKEPEKKAAPKAGAVGDEEPAEDDGVAMSLDAVVKNWKENVPKKKKTAGLLIVLFIIVALVLVFLFFGKDLSAKYKEAVDPGVEVPSVTGMTKEEAEKTVEDAGFLFVSSQSAYSDTVAEGSVISQSPEAETKAEEGTSVTVVVSLGAETAMPNLLGMTEEEAEEALKAVDEDLRLTVDEEEVYSEDYEAGTIAKQSVKANTSLDDVDEVVITMSKGSEYVEVPTLTGLSEEDATKAAEDEGLTVEVTEEYSDSVASGEVISQGTDADSQAKNGDTVSIVVSKGPAKVDVPNVVGTWQSEAEPKLEDLGFTVEITSDYSESVEHGRVLTQSVTGSAAKGSTITLCISLGSKNPSSSSSSSSGSGSSNSGSSGIWYVG